MEYDSEIRKPNETAEQRRERKFLLRAVVKRVVIHEGRLRIEFAGGRFIEAAGATRVEVGRTGI